MSYRVKCFLVLKKTTQTSFPESSAHSQSYITETSAAVEDLWCMKPHWLVFRDRCIISHIVINEAFYIEFQDFAYNG